MKHHQIIRAHTRNFLADSPYYASSTVHICHHRLSRLSIFTCPPPKKCFLYVQEHIYTSCSVSSSISYTVIHKHGLAININCAVSVTSLLSSIWVHSHYFLQFNWFIYICSQLLYALCMLQKRAGLLWKHYSHLGTPLQLDNKQYATNWMTVAKGLYSSTFHNVLFTITIQLLISVFPAFRCRSTSIEISRPLGVHRPHYHKSAPHAANPWWFVRKKSKLTFQRRSTYCFI